MKRRLDLGSGAFPWRTDDSEWEHLDANVDAPHVEWIGDAGGVLPFESATFAELRATDVLEHLSYRQTDAALREWARVLCPGAKFYVQVPDAETIMGWYVQEPARLLNRLPAELPRTREAGAAWRLFGGQEDGVQVKAGYDWKLNAHYALFSRDSLVIALDAAGFAIESVERNEHPNLCCRARKR